MNYFRSIVSTSAVAVLILLSCCQKKQVPLLELSYDLDERHFDELAPDTKHVSKLGICDLIAADWDSMIVVNPYVRIEQLEALSMGNFSSIEDELEVQSNTDFKVMLLFTKSNDIIAYSNVSFRPVDFSKLIPPRTLSYTIIKRSECKDIYIEKKQYKIGAAYDIYRAQDSKE